MTLTLIVIAALFIFGCCAIPGFARRLWKLAWRIGAAVVVLVALALLAGWVYNIVDGIIHPPGSDAQHEIKVELNQLGNPPPEGKFWTYKDPAGHEWTQKNGSWMVWYKGAWTKSGNDTLDAVGTEPDFDVAARFTKLYFALHPDEAPPKDYASHFGDFTPPESDIGFTAVLRALHPDALDAPVTDKWTLTEIERMNAYAKSRGKTLSQIVWEENAQPTPAPSPLKSRAMEYGTVHGVGKKEEDAIKTAMATIHWSLSGDPATAAQEDYDAIQAYAGTVTGAPDGLGEDLVSEGIYNYQPTNPNANGSYFAAMGNAQVRGAAKRREAAQAPK